MALERISNATSWVYNTTKAAGVKTYTTIVEVAKPAIAQSAAWVTKSNFRFWTVSLCSIAAIALICKYASTYFAKSAPVPGPAPKKEDQTPSN